MDNIVFSGKSTYIFYITVAICGLILIFISLAITENPILFAISLGLGLLLIIVIGIVFIKKSDDDFFITNTSAVITKKGKTHYISLDDIYSAESKLFTLRIVHRGGDTEIRNILNSKKSAKKINQLKR